MIEETIEVPVTWTVVIDIAAARDLQDWCEAQPGLICNITSMADGGYNMAVEGRTVDRKEFTFGDTVTWDGRQFIVTKPET
jgi:hypothetical protein